MTTFTVEISADKAREYIASYVRTCSEVDVRRMLRAAMLDKIDLTGTLSPTRANKGWKQYEVDYVCDNYKCGRSADALKSQKECAEKLGRTTSSIMTLACKLKKNGLLKSKWVKP